MRKATVLLMTLLASVALLLCLAAPPASAGDGPGAPGNLVTYDESTTLVKLPVGDYSSLRTEAAAAAALSTCGSGYTLVGAYAVNGPTGRVGTVEIGWNGTRNCAVNRAYGWTYGVAKARYVRVGVVGSAQYGSDAGVFRYYAGPAYSGPSAGRCIWFDAGIGDWGGNWNIGYLYVPSAHCG